MEKECAAIKKSALTMAWHMRGGASYTDILNMSYEERKEISGLIEDHMEITKKSGLPYY
jgi:hypothetical protein